MPRTRVLLIAAVCAAAALFAGAALLLAFGDPEPAPVAVSTVPPELTPTPSPTSTPTPTATPTPTPSPTPSPTATPAPITRVDQVRLPRFDVASGVESIGFIYGNQLDTPKNPHNTGWYSIFDPPGQPGNAVFSAHVDYFPNIKGPFNQLAKMVPGDQVVVVAGGREMVYEVTSFKRWTVDTIPMSQLIWPKTRPADEQWITLITCGGRFVASRPGGPGSYLDRDVVVARRIE